MTHGRLDVRLRPLYGAANDGDDLIDFGDSPNAGSFYGYGQGGNDKIFGGLVAE